MANQPTLIASGNAVTLTQPTETSLLEGSYGQTKDSDYFKDWSDTHPTYGDKPFRGFLWQNNRQ